MNSWTFIHQKQWCIIIHEIKKKNYCVFISYQNPVQCENNFEKHFSFIRALSVWKKSSFEPVEFELESQGHFAFESHVEFEFKSQKEIGNFLVGSIKYATKCVWNIKYILDIA